MAKKTEDQWKEIFEAQQDSGLSIPDYCQQHQINRTTFYNRRAKLGLSPEKSKPAFVKAKPATTNKSVGLSLKLGDATLFLPGDTSPQWIAQLLKTMAV